MDALPAVETASGYSLGLKLFRVCSSGNLEHVKLLLEAGASSTWSDRDGNTPLHVACMKGHLEVAVCLSARAGGVEAMGMANSEGETPWFLACTHGRLDVVKWLYGSVPEIRAGDAGYMSSRDGWSALAAAICGVGRSAKRRLPTAQWLYESFPELRGTIIKRRSSGISAFDIVCRRSSPLIVGWVAGLPEVLPALRRLDMAAKYPGKHLLHATLRPFIARAKSIRELELVVITRGCVYPSGAPSVCVTAAGRAPQLASRGSTRLPQCRRRLLLGRVPLPVLSMTTRMLAAI